MNQSMKQFVELTKSAPKSGLPSITPVQEKQLEEVFYRFHLFAGIAEPDDEAARLQMEADCQQYPHLLKFNAEQRPVISSERAAEFMHRVSGLPVGVCAAWEYQDFVDTVASGFVPGDPQELIHDAHKDALGVIQKLSR